MICGGADELHFLTTGVFDLVQAASINYNDKPDFSPRPFDKDRDGVVCGEGSGCLILENMSTAIERGADIFGEIIGFCTRASGIHMATPDKNSVKNCITAAIESSGLNPSDIDYINAHATGTLIGDSAEAQAIRDVFGKKQPCISSLKGFMGHTLGASGAIETVASLMMMHNGVIIPTKNLENPDNETVFLNHVTLPQKRNIDIFLKNSSAFGGINAVLVIKRFRK